MTFDSAESLFDRLGGEAAVSSVVEDFYDLLLQDDRVSRFFANSNTEALANHVKAYLTVAFGGPGEYTGKALREAHAELALSEDDYNAVSEDLGIVLKNAGVGTEMIDEVQAVISEVKGDIVSVGKVSGVTVVYDLEPEHCELLIRHMQWVIQAVGSLDAVGTIIYDALFNGAGEGKRLFVSPKKVTAFRFISQVQRFVEGSDDVAFLDEELYNMSMRHIAYISPAQCKQYMPLFINTIVNVVKGVLDEEWDDFGAESWAKLLNYVGGMLIRNLSEFTGKVHLIRKSWASINSIVTSGKAKGQDNASKEGEEEEVEAEEEANEEDDGKAKKSVGKGAVNFGESLYFNLGVMSPQIASLFKRSKDQLAPLFGKGFGELTVLISDPMLLNEELYILGIRHLKYGTTSDLFPVFGQAVMVTLRSMLPRDWNWAHEDAWGWLWETCATFLSATIEQGHINRRLVDETMDRLAKADTAKVGFLFTERLFSLSDEVQDYFYKPNTMVAYILEKVLVILSSLCHEPITVSHGIRALGMRHIKYNIPPVHFHLFGKSLAFTLATVLEGYWTDEIETSWMSVFGFVMRCMTRAVNEGTNLVTKAMVNNSVDEMSDVLKQAPRRLRDIWILEVNVSGEVLSPFYWAVYDGKAQLAEFMLRDLLAIRADREKYYCGVYKLFTTHPGLVKNLAVLSPNLLPVLLDGLLWRSRVTADGCRKVNYFVSYLYGDPTTERYFDPYQTPLAELSRLRFPELFVHPVSQFLVDLKWSTFVRLEFARGQAYYFIIFVLFMAGYVGFEITPQDPEGAAFYIRIVLAAYNLIVLLMRQIPRLVQEVQRKQIAGTTVFGLSIGIPISLTSPLNLARLLVNLLLVVSFVFDRHIVGNMLENEQNDQVHSWAICLSAVLLWMLPFDLFSLDITFASFKFRIFNVMGDLLVCLLFSTCLIAGIGCSIVISNADGHNNVQFHRAHEAMAYLFAVLSGNYVLIVSEVSTSMLVFIFIFTLAANLFLLNLVVALFSTSTFVQNGDMEGLIYICRAQIVVEIETLTSLEARKNLWLQNDFDSRIEFDEGDLGLSGGVQVIELLSKSAKDSIGTDQIQRFPGEASPKLPWPNAQLATKTVDEKLVMMEAAFLRILKSMRSLTRKGASKKMEESELDKSTVSVVSQNSDI